MYCGKQFSVILCNHSVHTTAVSNYQAGRIIPTFCVFGYSIWNLVQGDVGHGQWAWLERIAAVYIHARHTIAT